VGELFPLLAGVLAGVVALRLASRRRRAAAIAAIAVSFGVIATLVNHEEAFLVPLDTAIVAVTALALVAAPRLWDRLARRARVAGPDERAVT
jgi:peptidoglycan/LPS O-acetylase OafA/YrhL